MEGVEGGVDVINGYVHETVRVNTRFVESGAKGQGIPGIRRVGEDETSFLSRFVSYRRTNNTVLTTVALTLSLLVIGH